MPDDSIRQVYSPVEVFGDARPARWLILCDHARNVVPAQVADGDLGLPATDMARHIAYDVGAEGVARQLARRLDAPCVVSNFSRLVIDPNRGEDDPTLLMKLYDGTVIPANRNADAAEVERRLNLCHRPYHAVVSRLAARHPDTVIVSVHSFTPQLAGRPPRPWHIALLSAADRRLADPLIALMQAQPDLCVGDNEPYGGHLPGDTIDCHAIANGRQNTLIELRNDLIATPEAQVAWADRLALMLTHTLAQITTPTP
jgi:predicted N-formylglutamate amidohydrolase